MKSNPELRDVINAELARHSSEITLQIMNMIEEKKKNA